MSLRVGLAVPMETTQPDWTDLLAETTIAAMVTAASPVLAAKTLSANSQRDAHSLALVAISHWRPRYGCWTATDPTGLSARPTVGFWYFAGEQRRERRTADEPRRANAEKWSEVRRATARDNARIQLEDVRRAATGLQEAVERRVRDAIAAAVATVTHPAPGRVFPEGSPYVRHEVSGVTGRRATPIARRLSRREQAILDTYFPAWFSVNHVKHIEGTKLSTCHSFFGDQIAMTDDTFTGQNTDPHPFLTQIKESALPKLAHEALHPLQRATGDWADIQGSLLAQGCERLSGNRDNLEYSWHESKDPDLMLSQFVTGHVEAQGGMFEEAVRKSERYKKIALEHSLGHTHRAQIDVQDAAEALAPFRGILDHVRNMPSGGYR